MIYAYSDAEIVFDRIGVPSLKLCQRSFLVARLTGFWELSLDREKIMSFVDVVAEISGNVWKVEAKVGDRLAEDDAVAILESMKMEIPVIAPEDGKVVEILVAEGDTVSDGDIIARIEV